MPRERTNERREKRVEKCKSLKSALVRCKECGRTDTRLSLRRQYLAHSRDGNLAMGLATDAKGAVRRRRPTATDVAGLAPLSTSSPASINTDAAVTACASPGRATTLRSPGSCQLTSREVAPEFVRYDFVETGEDRLAPSFAGARRPANQAADRRGHPLPELLLVMFMVMVHRTACSAAPGGISFGNHAIRNGRAIMPSV